MSADCERCGGQFRVELCDVGGGAGAPRDRIEAYLCYDCRQEVTHERLGVTDGGTVEDDTQYWRILGCGHCGHEFGTSEPIESLVCPDCGADFDRAVGTGGDT